MTPLEIARKNQEELKTKPPCNKCIKSERVGNTLFCTVTGKAILPQHENICICRGKRLKESEETE
jgi:hypothetical protein